MSKNTILYAILFSVILCLSGNTAFSQLKVKGDNGKVIIGTIPDESSQQYVEDFDNILSASIFGKGQNYRSGAKLSFGDFGRWDYWGWNVFVGEYDTTDTDKLWLHGKNGFYLTYGRAEGNETILSFDVFGDRRLHFNTELFTQGVKIPANKSSQQNAGIIKSSLDKINKIEGITYQYKFFNNQTSSSTHGGSSKEIADAVFFNNLNEQMNNYAPKKNGFNADKLKIVFPELVETDKDGNNYIDYTGLIPVLVEAIKEQSKIITAQSLKLKEMGLLAEDITTMSESSTDSNFTTKSTTTDTNTSTPSDILANAFLYQNTPNPFNTTTEIKYFLPEGSTNAYIYVFNLQGNLLLTYNLSDNGFGSVIINGSSLNAGMYIYSLVVNGQEAETKRMILTK